MNTRKRRRALAAADPVDRERLERLDLGAMEGDLMADTEDERPLSESEVAPGRPKLRRTRLALGVVVLAGLALVALLVGGGGGGPGEAIAPSRAYGAELVRFAESTPLLLLEGQGWRVQNVVEQGDGEGSMEFVTGAPVPYESIMVTGNSQAGETETGMLPAGVRQRRVELRWFGGGLGEALTHQREVPHPHGERWVEMPVLDTTAEVDTRAELFTNAGGPGDRQMVAFFADDGYTLEVRASVPDDEAFEERLGWLTSVDSETWLDAMPAKVVKEADHDLAVREMLADIPVPSGFDPSQIPDEGVTTDRYQVGAAVAGTVACQWLRQWGEARARGDAAGVAEAVDAMASSRSWSILQEMAEEGAYPEVLWEDADAMKQGYWEWNGERRALLPHAEGLGCAERGVPLRSIEAEADPGEAP